MSDNNEKANPKGVAFSDFKKAISNEEFEALLSLAKEEHEKNILSIAAKDRFEKKTEESIRSIKEQSLGMPAGLAEKLVEGFKRKAHREAFKEIGKSITRSNALVDFINRFEYTNDTKSYLDFGDLKQE